MCEVTLQWIQRSIVEAEQKGLVKIAPPILSRVFNELGNGIVYLNNARKIKDFPFPFPMAQLTIVMMIVQSVIMPFIAASTVESGFWAVTVSFVVSFSFWGIVFIALELEMPYGDDPNDLPLLFMAKQMNDSLRTMIDYPLARKVPGFAYDLTKDLDCWDVDLDTDLSESARSGFCRRESRALEDDEYEEVDQRSRAAKLAESPNQSRRTFIKADKKLEASPQTTVRPERTSEASPKKMPSRAGNTEQPLRSAAEVHPHDQDAIPSRATSAASMGASRSVPGSQQVADSGARARLMGAIERFERFPTIPPDVSSPTAKKRPTWDAEYIPPGGGANGMDHRPPDIVRPERPTAAPPAMPGQMSVPMPH
jgi:hypothetical protein